MLKVRTLNLSFYSLPFLAFQSKNRNNSIQIYSAPSIRILHSALIHVTFFFVFSCLSLSFSFELIQRICDLCVIRAYCFAANCTSSIYLHNRLRLKIVYIKYAGGRCDSISFSLSISLFHSVSLTLTHLDELLC